MELHQLRYAVSIARHLNFSKAAAELCVTQPALSHQIAKLEAEIGSTLFERKTRSVKLTAAGEQFVRQAETVLAGFDDLQQSMQAYRSVQAGILRLGTLPLSGAQTITAVIPSFQSQHPGIQIRITEAGGSHELLKLLLAGELDIAYVFPPKDKDYGTKILFHPLIKGNLVLLTAKQHRLAATSQVALPDAAAESFIFPHNSHSMYSVALNACRTSGFEPKIACECSQLTTVCDLVANGFGIAFASSQSVAAPLPANVQAIPIVPPIDRTLCLAVLAHKLHSPVISRFAEFMFRTLPPV